MTTISPRTEAFRKALLNTCVRYARRDVPELTLSNCLQNLEFVAVAIGWLRLPFFITPIEPAMEAARQSLIRQLRGLLTTNQAV